MLSLAVQLSQKRRDTWLARLKRAELKQESYQYIRVCSDHFVNGMRSALYDDNNRDWAPSLKLVYEFQVTGRDRYERMMARTARKRHYRQIDICSSPELESDHEPETGTASQTNLTSMDIIEAEQTLKSLRKEIDKVTMEKEKEEHRSLLDKLVPGDRVLADCGFDIQDSVGSHCARLSIPAFTKGKNQLSGIDVEQSC